MMNTHHTCTGEDALLGVRDRGWPYDHGAAPGWVCLTQLLATVRLWSQVMLTCARWFDVLADLANHDEPGLANADVQPTADGSHVVLIARRNIRAGAEVSLLRCCMHAGMSDELTSY